MHGDSTLTPTFYIGKGFGHLPELVAWLRPLTISATAAVAMPTESPALPRRRCPPARDHAHQDDQPEDPAAALCARVQPGHQSVYRATGPGALLPGGMGSTDSQRQRHSTDQRGEDDRVNQGVIWVNGYLQVGVEAIIPINAQSGRDVGVRAQAHLYLPAIFPDFYGKPIFGK